MPADELDARLRDIAIACAWRSAHDVDPVVLERIFPDLRDMDVASLPRPDERERRHGFMTAASEGRVAVWGGRALFAVASSRPVALAVGGEAVPLARVGGTSLWVAWREVATGTTTPYEFSVDGAGLGVGDVAGFRPESEPSRHAPRGRLVGPWVVASTISSSWLTRYWLHISHGVVPGEPAPAMIWMDGDAFASPRDVLSHRLRVVSDNLVAAGALPPLVHVLIAPSTTASGAVEVGGRGIRGIQYDTVSDAFARHICDDVLVDARRRQALRQDAYSVALGGVSSGAAAAFGAAWFRPDLASRMHVSIGSFTALDTTSGSGLGAAVYPVWAARERRNLRVWLSGGTRDLELAPGDPFGAGAAGSWTLANLSMASALRRAGYDIHVSFGEAGHNSAHAAVELPQALTWLWDGYDPGATTGDFRARGSQSIRVQIDLS